MRLAILAVFAIVVVYVSAQSEIEKKFNAHKEKYGLKFSTEQENADALKYFTNVENAINKNNNDPTSTIVMGHNEFSHLSPEVKKKRNGLKNTLNAHRRPKRSISGTADDSVNQVYSVFTADASYTPPASLDWVAKGFTTPVQNQQQCGDCYAFATAGAAEAFNYVHYNQLVPLSPQEITDCTNNNLYQNEGCNGGNINTAYDYIIKTQALSTMAAYPFVSGNGRDRSKCQAGQSGMDTQAVKVPTYYNVNGDDKSMMQALNQYGPYAVGIDASPNAFQNYVSGVLTSSTGCSSTTPDHAVLLVGYGTLNGVNYWKIKNSWGTSWGMSGYFYLARNGQSTCAIYSSPTVL